MPSPMAPQSQCLAPVSWREPAGNWTANSTKAPRNPRKGAYPSRLSRPFVAFVFQTSRLPPAAGPALAASLFAWSGPQQLMGKPTNRPGRHSLHSQFAVVFRQPDAPATHQDPEPCGPLPMTADWGRRTDGQRLDSSTNLLYYGARPHVRPRPGPVHQRGPVGGWRWSPPGAR